jgi:RNA polymerase sigma-70 factor (ECF subfamily)
MASSLPTGGNTTQVMSVRDPDIRLMVRVRDHDDAEAFADLVDRYQSRLVGVLRHILGGQNEEAEDLAQEVFLRVYRTRKKYRPRAKFATWLFTIANNLALNALRSRRRKPTVPLPAQDSGPMGARPAVNLVADSQAVPTRRLAQTELSDMIRAALDGLNERQRLAVVLNKFEEMNYADIAEVMGLTDKAVKSLLSRARARLRDALQDYIHMNSGPAPALPPGEAEEA